MVSSIKIITIHFSFIYYFLFRMDYSNDENVTQYFSLIPPGVPEHLLANARKKQQQKN